MSFGLVIKTKPKVVKRARKGFIRINKITKGKVIIDENGEYKVCVDLDTDDLLKPKVLLPFTERSFKLDGRETIFSRTRDEHNNYIRYVRSKEKARWFPGSPEAYVPFCPNWIVKGYVLKDENGSMVFDFKNIIAPDGWKCAEIDDE